MKISKKAEYALRAVLAMSRRSPGTLFSIHTLSLEEGIPLKFLEQILLLLRKGGILISRRGAGGGYIMAKTPDKVSIGEILALVEGPLDIIPGDSKSQGVFGLQSAFGELQREIETWLSKTTLQDVLQAEQSQDVVSFEI